MIVEKNLDDSDFTIEQFAKEMALSRVHLNRKLKALTGKNSSHFILVIRLERAAQLFRNNVENISQIVYMVGFNNLSYFARAFKAHFGVTPSSYKKASQKSLR